LLNGRATNIVPAGEAFLPGQFVGKTMGDSGADSAAAAGDERLFAF
jgi:hypothetical protein